MRKHTGEMFPCDLCNWKGTCRWKLQKHKEKKHGLVIDVSSSTLFETVPNIPPSIGTTNEESDNQLPIAEETNTASKTCSLPLGESEEPSIRVETISNRLVPFSMATVQ